jgi:hypothetical protein
MRYSELGISCHLTTSAGYIILEDMWYNSLN